jgi:cytochrome c2
MKHPALGLLALVLASACDPNPTRGNGRAAEAQSRDSVSAVVSTPASAPTAAFVPPRGKYHAGDAARGRELVDTFECNRCHTVQAVAPAPRDKHCVQCHDDISRGQFPAPASAMARWKKTVDAYTVNPSLVNVGARLDPEWLYGFLLDPRDLRPHLSTSMPKLDLKEQDAADLVAYLTSSVEAPAAAAPGGSADKGRTLFEQKGCGSCHEFSGAPGLLTRPNSMVTDEQQKRAIRLAPDLRFTRERFRRDAMVAWLRDPKSLKNDTLMPTHGLNEREAADVSAYLYDTELSEVAPQAIPARLPVLTRKVEFQEVMDKVFGVTCRHCHSDPDAALGDGGPGNTGGFGFAAKGLDLATYRGVAAGYLDEKRERTSVFLPLPDGTPRLIAALLARQKEESGERDPEVRGMPLGLPALTAEQIQLVESWVAQGRPR